MAAYCKEADIPFQTITNEDEAISMRTSFASYDKGVFFIPFEFCRGLDLKLKVDAHCIILDVKGHFRESDVLQAMGRACRSQGQGIGTIYTVGDTVGSASGWDLIKARSEKKSDDGGLNLRRLFEVSNKLNYLANSVLVSAFKEGNWQIDPAEFKQKFSTADENLKKIKLT